MKLINADLVAEKIKAKCNSGQWAEAVVFGMEKALYLINTAPTVERPHGKWIISEVRCPYCLEYFDTDCYDEGTLDKCPNCGADMREGDAE